MSTPEDWRASMDALHKSTIETAATAMEFDGSLDALAADVASLPEGSAERRDREALLLAYRMQLQAGRGTTVLMDLMSGLVEQFMALAERVDALEAWADENSDEDDDDADGEG